MLFSSEICLQPSNFESNRVKVFLPKPFELSAFCALNDGLLCLLS